MPAWERGQPFRLLCHNGEINIIAGNAHLMRAREGRFGADWPELGDEGEALRSPLLDETTSDSGMLDAALELLVAGGRDLPHAPAMLTPQVREGRRDLSPAIVDFFRYRAALAEPWDGPAALMLADGDRVVARPAGAPRAGHRLMAGHGPARGLGGGWHCVLAHRPQG